MARSLPGLRAAVVVLGEVTAPDISVVPCFKVMVEAVMVNGFIASLKVT